MSNKRKLKQAINFVCEELFTECVSISLYKKDVKADNVDAVLSSIIKVHNDYLRRISHPEPGMSQKAYFKDLTTNFDKEVSEIIDHLVTL